jgi:hypothetical protein
LTLGTDKVTRSNFKLKACSLGFTRTTHVSANGRLMTGPFSRVAPGHSRVGALGWVALPSRPVAAADAAGASTSARTSLQQRHVCCFLL